MGRKNRGRSAYFRVSLTLPKELDSYLENLGSDIKAAGGFKLAKTEIIRALIMVSSELKLDLNNIDDENELKNRILNALKNN